MCPSAFSQSNIVVLSFCNQNENAKCSRESKDEYEVQIHARQTQLGGSEGVELPLNPRPILLEGFVGCPRIERFRLRRSSKEGLQGSVSMLDDDAEWIQCTGPRLRGATLEPNMGRAVAIAGVDRLVPFLPKAHIGRGVAPFHLLLERGTQLGLRVGAGHAAVNGLSQRTPFMTLRRVGGSPSGTPFAREGSQGEDEDKQDKARGEES